jgi:hypothetical protein
MIINDRISKPLGYLDLVFEKRIAYIMLGLIIGLIACSASSTAIDGCKPVESGEFDAIGIVTSKECIYYCTGTLIQGNVVLTAAHCFDGSGRKAKFAVDGHSFEGTVQRYQNNDLALIILNTDVSKELGIKPIPIAKKSNLKRLKIIGFRPISESCEKSSKSSEGQKYKCTFCTKYDEPPGTKHDEPARTVEPCNKGKIAGINSGDSGAPALDAKNQIVAINHGVVKGSKMAILFEINEDEYKWIQSEMKEARNT